MTQTFLHFKLLKKRFSESKNYAVVPKRRISTEPFPGFLLSWSS